MPVKIRSNAEVYSKHQLSMYASTCTVDIRDVEMMPGNTQAQITSVGLKYSMRMT
jgi:hypothetical protein